MATNYLKKIGYEVISSNYFNQKGYRIGEIDIIAEDRKENQLVFVEVKARKGSSEFVCPGGNMTNQKIKKIIKAVNYFLRKENLVEKNWRVDLVEVFFDFQTRKAQINHIKAIHF